MKRKIYVALVVSILITLGLGSITPVQADVPVPPVQVAPQCYTNGPWAAMRDIPIFFEAWATKGVPPYIEWLWEFKNQEYPYETFYDTRQYFTMDFDELGFWDVRCRVTDSMGHRDWSSTKTLSIVQTDLSFSVWGLPVYPFYLPQMFEFTVNHDKGNIVCESYYIEYYFVRLSTGEKYDQNPIYGGSLPVGQNRIHYPTWQAPHRDTYMLYAVVHTDYDDEPWDNDDNHQFSVGTLSD